MPAKIYRDKDYPSHLLLPHIVESSDDAWLQPLVDDDVVGDDVVGDGDGTIGIGYGKAKEVPAAIQKAMDKARKNMRKVHLKDETLQHEVIGEHGAANVYMQPASEGTGVIAGGAARPVLELAGFQDILTKSIGSNNPSTVVRATINALDRLKG